MLHHVNGSLSPSFGMVTQKAKWNGAYRAVTVLNHVQWQPK